MTRTALTCVLADDHPAVLDSVARFLVANDLKVAAAVGNGADALEAIHEFRPSVAVVDMRLPGIDGIELCRRVVGSGLETAILVYTGYGDAAYLADAIASGVRGFLVKDAPLPELVRAIEMVGRGEPYIDPTLAGSLVGGLGSSTPALTDAERALMQMLADGLTTDDISQRTSTSRTTAQTRIIAVMQKLNTGTRAQAVATAVRQGWIS
jgi:two-component system, NarL family, nitrate/nitrite response regulator NarL